MKVYFAIPVKEIALVDHSETTVFMIALGGENYSYCVFSIIRRI